MPYLDDAARTQVEVVLDDLQQLLLGVLGGAVVKHSDRNGLCHADGVRHLRIHFFYFIVFPEYS